MNPRVSVITTVYNCEKYIDECINSILNQSLKDFELIIVDDGSTDDTPNRLEQYKDPRVKVFRQENAGIYQAANKAVSLSTGSLIAVLDADDYALPDRLETQVAFMEKNPDYVFCGSRYLKLLDGKEIPTKIQFVQTDSELRRTVSCFNPFAHSSIIYRKASYLEIGGYDESFKIGGDFDLLIRLLKLGKGCNLDRDLVVHRIHKKSTSRIKERIILTEALIIKWKAFHMLGGSFAGTLYSLFKNLVILILPGWARSALIHHLQHKY